MRRLTFLVCTFATLALILPVHAVEKSDTKVKATAKASTIGADGKQTVTITLEMLKGWHIYANPVRAEDFESNKTEVAITAKSKVEASVKYPEGKPYTVKLGKEEVKMRIYKDTIDIQAVLTRTTGDLSPLQVSITVNACDANNCLEKGIIKLTVPSTK